MVDRDTTTIIEWGKAEDYKKLGGLTGKNKKQFNASSLGPGTYGLVVISPDKTPRPEPKCLVKVELKGHSVNGREIFQDSFDLILKKSPLVEHEFEIYEQDAPAMISLTLTANHVKVSIEMAANISRLSGNSGFSSSSNLAELSILTEQNLSVKSLELEKAEKKRLGRPFLYLVSLHPHTRNQISSSLHITGKEVTLHQECYDLLFHSSDGLSDRNKSVASKMTHSADAGNWQSLVLGMLEENMLVNMGEYAFGSMGVMSDKDVQKLELDAIKKIAQRAQEVIKDKKVPGKQLVDDLCESPYIKEQIFNNLIKGGIEDPVIHRFTIELAVRLRGTGHKKDQPPEELPNYTPGEVVTMLKERVFSPVSHNMFGNEGKKKAKKGGTMAAKIGFNQFILMAIIPPLGVAFLGYNLANAIFGATMNVVSAVVLQLLSQKLLLAAQGIYVPKLNNDSQNQSQMK